MKALLRISAFTLLFVGVAAFAQTPVTVKQSPASDMLVQLAKDHAANSKALELKFQQARAALDQSNKSMQDEIAAANKALTDDLRQDKKYKGRLEHIDDLQKKLADNGTAANAAFVKDVGPLQQKVSQEAGQLEELEKVVKAENNLPDGATFDLATGKWTEPKK